MKKNYLITGAAGFIGFHLSRRLLEQEDCSIIGIDNLNDYYDVSLKEKRLDILSEFKGFRFVKGDISDKAFLEKLFSENKFDVVVNLAAQAGVRYSLINPDAYIASNLIGFYNILEIVRHHPVEHLVYASSSSVYGRNKKVPYSVDDKTDQPVSLYAATKKSNELLAYSYCNLYGIKATGLRFFTVYGPYGRPDMAYFSFTKKILADQPIEVFNNGDMYRDFTYIDDIVTGVVNVMKKTPDQDETGVTHKVYNIGNNHTETLAYFVDILQEVIGKKANIIYKPMQPGDVYQTYADVDPLVHDFNFKPNTSLKDGLSKFWDWYKKEYC